MAKPYVEFEPIGPDIYLSVDEAYAGIMEAVKKAAEGMKEDFEKTVATWDDPADFVIDGPIAIGNTVEASVGTDSQKYKWLNDGVRVHTMSTPGVMIFRTGYQAKTKPRMLSSMYGGRTDSGPWVSKKTLTHPGIEARQWDKVIAEKWKQKFIRDFGLGIGPWARFKRALKGVAGIFGV